jgi:alkylation response protein AidB-like acyl-CoA dehydrogenase
MSEAGEELLFDLTLTDEQRMNRDTVQRFAAEEIRPQASKSDEERLAPAGYYQKTLELGLTLMPIPEALGGAGVDRSPLSNVLNVEDLAHGDLSLALGTVSPLAFANTLLDQGSEAQREKYLPQLCGDKFFAVTTALAEPRTTFEPTRPICTARPDSDCFVISGTKSLVPLGLDAEFILVVVNLEGAGPAAFIVPGDSPGLTRTPELNMGLRPLQTATLEFDNVVVSSDALLGDGPFDLKRFIDLSRIGVCGLAVGTCQAVLDYVTEYCNERIAFGEPITNRQSVAFMIADMAIELDAMRLMTWRAAARAEQGLDFHEQAYLAKVFCAEHAMKIGSDGVQLLGGHGFCREHPVEQWYRNLRAIAILEGVAAV